MPAAQLSAPPAAPPPDASLPSLMRAARTLAWRRWEAHVRLSTVDGLHWQCVATDGRDGAVREDCPAGRAATPSGAVEVFFAAVHDAEGTDPGRVGADDLPPSLADAFPAAPAAPVTFGADELDAAEAADGDVAAEVA